MVRKYFLARKYGTPHIKYALRDDESPSQNPRLFSNEVKIGIVQYISIGQSHFFILNLTLDLRLKRYIDNNAETLNTAYLDRSGKMGRLNVDSGRKSQAPSIFVKKYALGSRNLRAAKEKTINHVNRINVSKFTLLHRVSLRLHKSSCRSAVFTVSVWSNQHK